MDSPQISFMSRRPIGSHLGQIHHYSINRNHMFIAHLFLCFSVDIPVDNPLPAGFFQPKDDESELWIQFKLERLSDFWYCCGMLNHVTVRCHFAEPALVTSMNGIIVRLYGPWLRVEVPGGSMSANPPIIASQRQELVRQVD